MARPTGSTAPLVLHVVYRFDTGGLENGVVNLINHMPADAYRHAVVALTEVVPAFASRIRRSDVEFISLHKPPGHGARLYPQLVRLMRRLQPAIVHTRNLAALECQVPAWWAGVPGRLHGEHGRDIEDLDGSSRRHQWMRRAYSPFVQRYVALSRDLGGYLTDRCGISASRVEQVYNGVDTVLFTPATGARPAIAGCPFEAASHWLVGTVGRMQTVKDQPLLARAFAAALAQQPALRDRMRLVMVGSGPLREECRAILTQAGLAELAWLPGERADVPDVMRGLDCFVLPSRAEGISNTILEAMASGLPIVSTRVVGVVDCLEHERDALLVEAKDAVGLANAIARLLDDEPLRQRLARRALGDVRRLYSWQSVGQQIMAAYGRVAGQPVSSAWLDSCDMRERTVGNADLSCRFRAAPHLL